MSIIVWNGSTIAADRQGTCADMKVTLRKIRVLKSGVVLAWTGAQEQGIALVGWYEAGADRDKWPAFQKGENWTQLIVADANGADLYEREPEPQMVHDEFMAWGSGRDFAMGALAMGADAKTAVEIASRFNVNCGLGCDVITLHDPE